MEAVDDLNTSKSITIPGTNTQLLKVTYTGGGFIVQIGNDYTNKTVENFIDDYFDKKKFIIFFEGWERRKYINYNVCGKSNYDGKIAIYFTASRFKKYIGDDIILKNNKIVKS